MSATGELVMAFDYGARRIGVAVGQATTGSASPVGVVAVRDTPDLVLRTLDLAQEIDLAVEAQVRARDASFEPDGYRVFRRSAMERMAAMQQQGIGEWFGAMVEGALAADASRPERASDHDMPVAFLRFPDVTPPTVTLT